MTNRPLAMTMLLWTEAIVSVRALLFCVPVLISKDMGAAFSPINLADWFILYLTASSLLYFSISLASIFGHKQWKIFHFGATALMILLSAGLWREMMQISGSINTIYLFPLYLSLLSLACILIFSKEQAKVSVAS